MVSEGNNRSWKERKQEGDSERNKIRETEIIDVKLSTMLFREEQELKKVKYTLSPKHSSSLDHIVLPFIRGSKPL